ncbi:adenylate kinase-like protein 2, putative [Plasmodium gallinaceum]|uniref:Adenylate kinase-like protein 2, putative n=1 Tax=Plasmodium gallinaceum TaxID=5849 RepID=A0A1J1H0R2_PLAGA|nr:adenylate kinase-like protein 2, putative [Plasmodium gallinaceum]CRG96869.1 adenylate kinase-like protein 2, putative [Plasmodium gallinaceum]
METLLDSETLKKFEEETNEYIRKKKVKKLFDIILKNVLINKPENIYFYIYSNIYSFLLNKIFIIGPPLLKITSVLSSSISKTFDYYHISISELIKSHISYDINNIEENSINKKLINDDLVSSIIKTTLSNLDAKKKRGYVVEGFPSTNIQANNCLQYLPSHVIVLFADEEYIYEKYEEENDTKIFSNIHNNIEENVELFEVKEVDPSPLKDKVKVYLRNVSGVLEVLENNKEVINLRDYNERDLIDYVTNLVTQNKDEWNSVLEDNSLDVSEEI